jgi:hypothetical protein
LFKKVYAKIKPVLKAKLAGCLNESLITLEHHNVIMAWSCGHDISWTNLGTKEKYKKRKIAF